MQDSGSPWAVLSFGCCSLEDKPLNRGYGKTMSMSMSKSILKSVPARTANCGTRRAFSVLCGSSAPLRVSSAPNATSKMVLLARGNAFRANSMIDRVNGKRFYSVIENGLAAPVVDYNKMKEIVEKNDPNYVIVDVRENDEFAAGHIPHAINLPCKSSPGALGLDPEEFKLTFGFDKPSKDKTLVFYCLAGVRAAISEELASTFDYEHRLNYAGSFKDWINHNGKIEYPQEAKNEEK